MTDLETFRRYFIEEFYEDYRDGLITRRSFTKKVAFLTGSMAAASAAMAAVGCADDELPAADAPMPSPTATTAPAATASAASAAPTTAVTAASGATAAPTSVAVTGGGGTGGGGGSGGGTGAGARATPQAGAASPTPAARGAAATFTEEITFASGPDQIGGYLARPAGDGRRAAVMVCHENRGLTEHIKDVTRRFADAGYVAVALDLLWREGGTAKLDPDAVPGALNSAGAERHVRDFQAASKHLQSLVYVDPNRIGMNGYCFGGGITWRGATAISELKAAVPFYGPAPDLSAVPNMKAAVFGVYAEQDTRINAGIDSLAQALKAAGVVHEMKVYPGVNHAFFNDAGARYDKPQANQAWQDMLAWFKKYL